MSGQSSERFPGTPTACRERGCTVGVFVDYGGGWSIHHRGVPPLLVPTAETAGDYWPNRVLDAFSAAHERDENPSKQPKDGRRAAQPPKTYRTPRRLGRRPESASGG